MGRRKLFAFAIDPDLAAALKRVKERDGIPESEQVRRAVRAWLQGKDGVFEEAWKEARRVKAARTTRRAC